MSRAAGQHDALRLRRHAMLGAILKSLLGRPLQGRRAARAAALLEAGMSQRAARDYEGARRSFEQAVALDPANARAHHGLGTLLARDAGTLAESALHLERALSIDPEIPDGWVDLGNVCYLKHDLGRAEVAFRTALETDPGSVLAHLNLGVVLKTARRLDEALVHLRHAHAMAPGAEGTLRNLVATLIESDACEEALVVAQAAAVRDPRLYDTHKYLGLAHQKLHEPERALRCYETALGMRSDDAELHDNRGTALLELGRLPEALACYERALALQPDFALPAFHRGLTRLQQGDYARGWEGYELRQLNRDYPERAGIAPAWDGASLAGRVLFISREQGLGDEIMFASCLPEVIASAGRCVIECEPRLTGIFRRSFPSASVHATDPDGSLPHGITEQRIDCSIAAGSLPRFLRRGLADFPRHHGYLAADPARIERWRGRLEALGAGRKVGISWSGGVRKTRRSLRSIPLDHWLPILRTPGVRFVSLQYTPEAAAEVAEARERHGVAIEHWSEAIEDYEDTAALVCALDLVVSVCTAVIHLGGALGRPVWVMAPYSPEWRYGFSGEGMPWYPSVRVFRQPAFGAWEPVIEAAGEELARFAGATAA